MADVFTDHLDRHVPVIDLDAADQQRHVLVVTFAGGANSAVVPFPRLAAGADGEHLSIDVHAFANDQVARAAVFGMENGARYDGFDASTPGRCHGWPAVRGVIALIGAQTGTGPQPLPRMAGQTGPGSRHRPAPPPALSRRHTAMTSPVTLHNLYYLIDTTAWLRQRIGAHHTAYSAQVQDFVRCQVFDDHCPATGVAARMQLWCAAHGFTFGEAAVIEHDDASLTKPIRIVLATTRGVQAQPLAVVSIDGGPPQVYTDATDEHFWLSVDTIQIACPAGHGWTWSGDRYLYAADGSEEHLARLYGPSGSGISGCRACAAFDNGASDELCPCPGYAVYCPICATRCQVGLPEIPIIGQVPA